jgi:hypothetical protein
MRLTRSITGDVSKFAIESQIVEFWPDRRFMAYGYFTIIVNNKRYGLADQDDVTLSMPMRKMVRCIERRGTHNASFATRGNAIEIADYVNLAEYADNDYVEYMGLSRRQLQSEVASRKLDWLTSESEAFDDGSTMLHFDCGEQVRLVAYKAGEDFHAVKGSVADVWLDADEFYGVLNAWASSFNAVWMEWKREQGEEGEKE